MGLRKTKTTTKLASISALSAGAVALCAPSPAVAGSIVDFKSIDTNLPTTVGFFSSSAFESKGMGVHSARFLFHTFATSSFSSYRRGVNFAGAGAKGAALRFATFSGHLAIVPAGVTWNSSSFSHGNRGAGRVASLRSRTFFSVSTTFVTRTRVGLTGSFRDQYALFEFNNGGVEDYGWVQLSLSWSGLELGVDKVHPDEAPPETPYLTISDYAYDSSGAFIPAGDTGVPEPASVELAGLGALMLGAAGVRRWRAAKKAAA